MLTHALDGLLAVLRTECSEDQFHAAAQRFMHAVPSAPRDEVHRAMAALAATFDFRDAPQSAYGAIVAGALIEQGFDPTPVEAALVRELHHALVLSGRLADACAQAVAAAGGKEEEGEEEDDPDARFQAERDRLAAVMPEEARAWTALDRAWPAGIALFSASAAARGRARELTEPATRLAEHHSGAEWLELILSVLHDEPVLVIEPSTRRGILARISGVVDNFQLQTLLMDAFPRGLLSRPRVAPEAVAVARGEGPEEIDLYVPGALNMYIWAAVTPRLELPDAGDFGAQRFWIWGEGRPEDIPVFEGRRVILLGPRHTRGAGTRSAPSTASAPSSGWRRSCRKSTSTAGSPGWRAPRRSWRRRRKPDLQRHPARSIAHRLSPPVMNSRSPSGPPNAQLVQPCGVGMMPSGSPSAANTCTPAPELVHTQPRASTLKPSGTPGSITRKIRRSDSEPSSPTAKATMW
jgi:hypothetical protein